MRNNTVSLFFSNKISFIQEIRKKEKLMFFALLGHNIAKNWKKTLTQIWTTLEAYFMNPQSISPNTT